MNAEKHAVYKLLPWRSKVNKNKSIMFSVVVILLVMLVSNCMAKEFKKNGYNIDIFWKQSGDRFKMWGDVEKGKSCKQLNLSIFFSNSKDSGSAHLEAAINNYSSTSRGTYRAKDKVYVSKKYRKYWHVDSIYTDCLQ